MPKVRVNDISMYYEQEGSGEDLVFISGLTCDHSIWDMERFTNHFRVLRFDNRGCGQTDVPESPFSMQTFAHDTISLCRTLGIKKAHFVGHSMGGHIAQFIGALYGEMVHKLIIACSEAKLSVLASLATQLQLELRQHNVPKKLVIESVLPLLFSPFFLESPTNIEKFVFNNLNYPYLQTDRGYQLQVEAIRQHDTRHLLAKIKAPTLIIGCGEDLLTPVKNSKYLKEHIPQAELKIIKDCGHVPYIEKKEEFLQIILNFIKA